MITIAKYWFISVCLFQLVIFSSIAKPATDIATITTTYEEAVEYVDQYSELIEEIRSHIDRSQFDLEALIEKLEFDSAKIIQFVKNDIYFEQYPGLLRGAQGTLLSNAGNSLDQSVLLATLLKDAGFDAQIVRGVLDETDASALIKQLAFPRNSQGSMGDINKFRATFDKLGAFLGVDKEEARREFEKIFESNESARIEDFKSHTLYQKFVNDIQSLENILESNGLELGHPDYLSDLIQEARDYYWVRYRTEQSEEWQDIHVAFHLNSLPQENIIESETYKESIPKERQHRIRIQAFVERKFGNKIEVLPVMTSWERPASNLIGHSITYRNHPDGYGSINEWSEAAFEQAIDSSESFYPHFNGNLADGAKVFDLLGNVVAPEDMQGPGIFRTISAKAGKATGLLSSMGKSKNEQDAQGPVQALLKHWIQITTIDPSGTEHSHDRVLAGVTGNKIEYDTEFKESLIRNVSFAVSVGGYPNAYLLDLSLMRLHSLRPVIYSGLFHGSTANLKPITELEYVNDADLKWADYLSLSSYLDMGQKFTASTLSYHSKPYVVAKYTAEGLTNVGEFTTDIIDNPRRAFKTTEGLIRPDYSANMLYGVWDTYAESMAVLSDTSKKFNAISVFAAAANQNINSIVITNKDKRLIDNLDLNTQTISNLNLDLEKNYVLITPATEVSNVSGFGWWRIDPRTGQTLGMTNNGGSITIEELELHVVNTLGKAYAAKGYRAALYCTGLTGALGLAVSTAVGDPSGGVAPFVLGWVGEQILKKLGLSWTPGMTMAAFLKDCVVAVALRL